MKCPSCNHSFDKFSVHNNDYTYCPMCGQLIDINVAKHYWNSFLGGIVTIVTLFGAMLLLAGVASLVAVVLNFIKGLF
jgi:uncharacterized paraquat-inducible protein A